MDKYILVRHNDFTTLSIHYYYRCMLCVYESERMIVSNIDVYVCVVEQEDRLDDPPCLLVTVSQPAVARLP